MDAFTVRNATESDFDAVMAVEQCWPEEQRATIDHFRSRLERFPQGFWVGEVDGVIVGVTTSCLVHYDPKDPETCKSWDLVTNKGYLHPGDQIAKPNALYIVSTAVLKSHQGKGLVPAFFRKHRALTHELRLPYSLTGSMLPRYDAYCRTHGEIPAHKYALLRVRGKPVDPLIRTIHACGYDIPDERHVIADYYPSPESRDYGAIMVYRNGALAAGQAGEP
jgi:hypothetical protein